MGRKPRKYYIDGHFYTVEELAEEVGVWKRAKASASNEEKQRRN